MNSRKIALGLFALCAASLPSAAQKASRPIDQDGQQHFPVQNIQFEELNDGSILVADENVTRWFANYTEYFQSPFFVRNGQRCGSAKIVTDPLARGASSDCSSSTTNPAAEYAPGGGELYRIPVVVHVLQTKQGGRDVSDSLIASQIDILNEDFRAMAGSNGAGGTDTRIEFFLAGTTRTKNTNWSNDGGTYYNSLSWDVNTYLNIYTNTAGGNLGYAYVPSGGGIVGSSFDRVVILWSTFGRNAPYGAPYNQGRTVTHEVGHYLGLYHTFDGGCASGSSPACYSNGDLICDTNPESSPNYTGCGRVTCSSSDPVKNYMDYSEDLCMDNFTSDQTRRMRCTLANFRVDLPDGVNTSPPGAAGSPNPSNGATGVATNVDLLWSAGSSTDSHDVYFGTSSNLGAGDFQGNQAGVSFDPGTLGFSTTYYWRVDEINAYGTTAGSTWSFTTSADGTGSGSIVLSVSQQTNGNNRKSNLSWTQAIAGPVEVFRNGQLIASGTGTSFTDDLGRNFSGTVTYTVCLSGTSDCSNAVTVTF